MADNDRRLRVIPRRFAWIVNNLFALAGAVTLVTAVIVFGFLFVIESLSAQPHDYLGVVFMLLPPVLAMGALLVLFGWWLDRRIRIREETGLNTSIASFFDLGRTTNQRVLLLVVSSIATIFVFSMAVTGYEVYEYTESVEFCGTTCHTVMKPQYAAHQSSPHARVKCADCHIGSGANWHVRSKMSGAYQIYAYAADMYPRPIPTPVHNLRPARDTCEQCHWPQMFHGDRQNSYRYYLSEGDEEPWEIDMQLKVGGTGEPTRPAQGIHWHVDPSNTVEYLAANERRDEIAEVRVTAGDGTTTVFRNIDLDLDDETLLEAGEFRTMDCVDCHNRPAHRYSTPVELINGALDRREIDPSIPEFKLMAIELFANQYETEEEALATIESELRAFYEEDYPEFLEENPGKLDTAIAVLQSMFRQNIFPEMRTRWDTSPDFSSHWIYSGCFRCHAGNMVSDAGQEVSSSCTTCHTIVGQGIRGTDSWQTAEFGQSLPFVHPLDGEIIDEPTLCTECHNGALGY